MKSAQIIDQVDLIRQVFSYAHRFRGKTFVIHVDHAAVDDARVTALVQDIVLLHQSGIRIVLIPGARQRIDEVLEMYHVEWRRENGVRIAGAEAIPFIKMAAFDVTNRFMTLLSAHNTNAVVGNWVRARGIGVVNGVDYEHAGVVERVQLDLLRTTLRQDLIPIFPCIGWSATGKPYNISSRELAFRIAVSLEAEKLFFITDRMGLNADNLELPPEIEATREGRISRLTVEEARRLLDWNGVSPEERLPGAGRPPAEVAEGEDRPMSSPAQPSGYHEGPREHLEFLRLAYLAAGAGVSRIHIVDGDQEGVTLAEERLPGAGRPPAEVAEGEDRPMSSPAQPSGYHEGPREHLEFLRLAYLAAGAGVSRIHIVDGDQEGVTLAEVFSDLGVGTMVHANVYQSIRPMRMEDVGKVHKLMQPLAEHGVLLARLPEEIAAHAEDYVVHETDGRIHGCGALHVYPNGEAEIAALAVDTRYEELGIGRRIVLYLMERAREKRLSAVFVLTTRTSDWFESIGFVRIGVERLPAEKRSRYDMDRNSIILRYDFSAE